MGCKIAYVQSDEITLLLTDYDTIQTQAWLGGNIQKIASISASMATMAFNEAFNTNSQQYGISLYSDNDKYGVKFYYSLKSKVGKAMFDSRVFQLPKEEVINNFIWRQQDATRNSIQSVAYANFSSKETYGKSCSELQDMLMLQKGVNWNDFSTDKKRGMAIIKESYELEDGTVRSRWIVDNDMPILTVDRNYIEKYVYL